MVEVWESIVFESESSGKFIPWCFLFSRHVQKLVGSSMRLTKILNLHIPIRIALLNKFTHSTTRKPLSSKKPKENFNPILLLKHCFSPSLSSAFKLSYIQLEDSLEQRSNAIDFQILEMPWCFWFINIRMHTLNSEVQNNNRVLSTFYKG